ncbi:MAG: hypothetical protein ACREUW_07960 [Burkholderiales bacterium]
MADLVFRVETPDYALPVRLTPLRSGGWSDALTTVKHLLLWRRNTVLLASPYMHGGVDGVLFGATWTRAALYAPSTSDRSTEFLRQIVAEIPAGMWPEEDCDILRVADIAGDDAPEETRLAWTLAGIETARADIKRHSVRDRQVAMLALIRTGSDLFASTDRTKWLSRAQRQPFKPDPPMALDLDELRDYGFVESALAAHLFAATRGLHFDESVRLVAGWPRFLPWTFFQATYAILAAKTFRTMRRRLPLKSRLRLVCYHVTYRRLLRRMFGPANAKKARDGLALLLDAETTSRGMTRLLMRDLVAGKNRITRS